MKRLIAVLVLLALPAIPAFAQPNSPPLMVPAPPVVQPPPLAIPSPVPSVVTPLPSPSYGVPPGINRGPVLGSGGTLGTTIRSKRPPKKRIKRRPRTSEILLIRSV